jgi:hypothetical protein
MAKEEASKPAPAESATATPNKAQAEFERYLKHMQAQQAGGMPPFMMPVALPPGYESAPGWAIPPSVAMLPRGPFPGAFGTGLAQAASGDSLTAKLGSTLRLGVDVINAALAGGVRVLEGISGMAYGYGESWHERGGCSCEACSCCEYDCCGGCECGGIHNC